MVDGRGHFMCTYVMLLLVAHGRNSFYVMSTVIHGWSIWPQYSSPIQSNSMYVSRLHTSLYVHCALFFHLWHIFSTIHSLPEVTEIAEAENVS